MVMHELGHLLGYEHSADGLMAPVLSAGRPSSAEAVGPLGQAEWRSSPSSFVLGPLSRLDEAFADLGRSEGGDTGVGEYATSPLLESADRDLPAAATVKSSDEATQARVPRRTRLHRNESELDDCFAQLAAAEDEGR